jgi:hypothetical protein
MFGNMIECRVDRASINLERVKKKQENKEKIEHMVVSSGLLSNIVGTNRIGCVFSGVAT